MVTPYSIRHKGLVPNYTGTTLPEGACDSEELLYVQGETEVKEQADGAGNVLMAWTYDVEWTPSEVAWASRWDLYLHMDRLVFLWIVISLVRLLLTFCPISRFTCN